MSNSCPISHELVDNNAVRFSASVVVVLAATALLLRSWPVLLILAVDFGIRGFGKSRFSPISLLGRRIAAWASLQKRPVDAAPKRFAARIGFIVSACGATLLLLHIASGGIASAVVLVFCALLEAAFGLCIGCRIYALLPSGVAQWVAR